MKFRGFPDFRFFLRHFILVFLFFSASAHAHIQYESDIYLFAIPERSGEEVKQIIVSEESFDLFRLFFGYASELIALHTQVLLSPNGIHKDYYVPQENLQRAECLVEKLERLRNTFSSERTFPRGKVILSWGPALEKETSQRAEESLFLEAPSPLKFQKTLKRIFPEVVYQFDDFQVFWTNAIEGRLEFRPDAYSKKSYCWPFHQPRFTRELVLPRKLQTPSEVEVRDGFALTRASLPSSFRLFARSARILALAVRHVRRDVLRLMEVGLLHKDKDFEVVNEQFVFSEPTIQFFLEDPIRKQRMTQIADQILFTDWETGEEGFATNDFPKTESSPKKTPLLLYGVSEAEFFSELKIKAPIPILPLLEKALLKLRESKSDF